ncbi:hypothetical protein [Qipengyuania sp. ASV99]|uniref:peptidylprolyl isomerase n=1 Tax=Qipengyuania sp. ASV99 TaxID=3399681 RepID=UPI003A4C76EC
MMNRRIAAVLAMAAAFTPAAFAPAAASAQAVLTSPVPTFHLVQLSVSTPEVAADEFMAKTEAIRSCTDAMNLGEELGAEVTRNRNVRASQIPEALSEILETLPAGHASPVFSDNGTVLRVLVLCGRT